MAGYNDQYLRAAGGCRRKPTNGVALLVTAGVLGLFGLGLATQGERVGQVARRPSGRDTRLVAVGLGGVASLLGGLFLVLWMLG